MAENLRLTIKSNGIGRHLAISQATTAFVVARMDTSAAVMIVGLPGSQISSEKVALRRKLAKPRGRKRLYVEVI